MNNDMNQKAMIMMLYPMMLVSLSVSCCFRFPEGLGKSLVSWEQIES
jgi:hypothetical protein